LLLAAGFLLRPYLPGIRLVPRRRALSRLERAVEAVERARGGVTEEERKALELLAAELRKSGSGGLAWTATELAWSPLQPPAEKTVALTESVRRELAGRTNGHRARADRAASLLHTRTRRRERRSRDAVRGEPVAGRLLRRDEDLVGTGSRAVAAAPRPRPQRDNPARQRPRDRGRGRAVPRAVAAPHRAR